jgi:membrane protease YdiL (CAAX protease family)
MTTLKHFFLKMAVIVTVWYLGLTYLPQIIGTCVDGECGFSAVEIVVSYAIPLAFMVIPIGLEMLLYRKGFAQALNDIGITRFRWTGIRIAAVYVLPLALFFPLLALTTNSPLTLQANWQWRFLNILIVNGLAEEIMMRGFVFRHMREGRSFWHAAALSTAYFAAYHLPLVFSAGVVVGVIGVISAVPLGFLTAYSYERGGSTIWGPAVLHAANNALVMLFALRAEVQPAASALYILLGIVVSTLMLLQVYRAGYERTAQQTASTFGAAVI